METNIFIEILILVFIWNKWKLKPKLKVEKLARRPNITSKIKQNLSQDLSKKILDSLTIGWLH